MKVTENLRNLTQRILQSTSEKIKKSKETIDRIKIALNED